MYYTIEQLEEKYGVKVCDATCARRIRAFKAKGLIIEQRTQGNRWHPTEYEVIDDSIISKEWITHPFRNVEVTEDGYMRNRISKEILTLHPTSDGYQCIFIDNKRYMAHRILMEVFCPVENMGDLLVDHKNGKRSDNRLENLEWVTDKQNQQRRADNHKEILAMVDALVQKYGYKKVEEIFKKDLTKYL